MCAKQTKKGLNKNRIKFGVLVWLRTTLRFMFIVVSFCFFLFVLQIVCFLCDFKQSRTKNGLWAWVNGNIRLHCRNSVLTSPYVGTEVDECTRTFLHSSSVISTHIHTELPQEKNGCLLLHVIIQPPLKMPTKCTEIEEVYTLLSSYKWEKQNRSETTICRTA